MTTSFSPETSIRETYVSEKFSIPMTRRQVDKALHTWGHAALQDSAHLLITEMAANAVRHCTGETFSVEVSLTQDAVRLSVTDSSPAYPQIKTSSHDDESGRGMMIVEALAQDWGVMDNTIGKTVWACLALTTQDENSL